MRRLHVFLSGLLLMAGVASAQIKITTPSLPLGYTNGIFYSVPLAATITGPLANQNPSVTWSLANGTVLPAGLTLNASTGLISGDPTATGVYDVVINVQINFSGFMDQVEYSLTINPPTVSIVTDFQLPDAALNAGYQQVLQATTAPALQVVWSVSPTALPLGLSMNSQGIITGIPETVGTYSFTVLALLANTGAHDTRTFTIRVFAGKLTITSASPLPTAIVGQPYKYTLTSLPGSGVTWSSAPAVPSLPGVTLDPNTGVLSGTPPITGTFSFQISATAPGFTPDTRMFSFFVIAGPVSITETSLPLAILSAPYSTRLHATGGLAPYLWRITGNAPPGLNLDLNTGILSGNPTAVGPYSFGIQVTDATGTQSARLFSMFVAGPVTIITGTLPNGVAGAAYNQTLSAGGGQAPYTWSILSGDIPPGLQFSSSGTLTGTPTRNGFFQFTIQVSDNGQRTATATLSVTVGGIAVSTSSLPDAGFGVAYVQNLQAIGGNAPYSWALIGGSLPPGLALNSSGALQGTATQLGSLQFTVQVTDATQSVAQKQLSLNVVQALQFVTTSLPGGGPGNAYSQTLSARGGTPPYNFAVNLGSLPPGLSMDASSGIISGTPTAAGNYTFAILLTDRGVQQVQQGFTINIVNNNISITGGNLNGTVGGAFSQVFTASGGTAPYSWSLASGILPSGLTLSPSGLLSGTPTAAGVFPITVSVIDASNGQSQKSFTLIVTSSTVPAVTISLTPDTTASAQQPQAVVSLSTPYVSDITGTLTLAFQSSVGGDDATVRFANGTRSATFTIPSGSTQAQAAALLTGTVAGAITLTASVQSGGAGITPSPAPTKTVAISPTTPVISSVTFQVSGSTITVSVTGYSSTREIISGMFHFAQPAGSTVVQNDITMPLSSAFATWYGSAASNATGGEFVLTEPFTLSQVPASSITGVTVTLSNTRGASAPVSQ